MAEIEYFYAAHSAYAYLGAKYFMDIAAAAGRRIAHKPVDLRRVVEATGTATFAARSNAHRAYFFGREIERWAEFRDVPIMAHLPRFHHHDTTLANCVLIAAMQHEESIDQLSYAFLAAHWCDDADLADPETLAQLIRKQGLDPALLLAAAERDETRAQYTNYTEEAIARSVFGSPTYGVDGDLFYGQDHLPLVARALERPFARGRYRAISPA